MIAMKLQVAQFQSLIAILEAQCIYFFTHSMIHSFTKVLEYDFKMFLEMCVPGITDCTVALVVFSQILSF